MKARPRFRCTLALAILALAAMPAGASAAAVPEDRAASAPPRPSAELLVRPTAAVGQPAADHAAATVGETAHVASGVTPDPLWVPFAVAYARCLTHPLCRRLIIDKGGYTAVKWAIEHLF